MAKFQRLLFESPSVAKGEEAELKRTDFSFERRLGEGGFGQVWRVTHRATQQQYAIKIVKKQSVKEMLNQFKREVRIMYELDHPHIIKLKNHFEDANYFYLIVELASGGNLFHKIKRARQLSEREAAQIFREVILAVEYMHSHIPAIIHRDIKPENIMLDGDGRAKLTDFGWSNFYSTASRYTLCGTLEYLPPEMLNNQGHNTSADIWSLGVLLFEMLVGNSPFYDSAQQALLRNISSGKFKFPRSFPPNGKDLVMKMLKLNPDERITATMVLKHSWMMQHPPIRETMTQDIRESIMLPDLSTDENYNVEKGYEVICNNTQEAVQQTIQPEKFMQDAEQAIIEESSEDDEEHEDDNWGQPITYEADNSFQNSIPTTKEETFQYSESLRTLQDAISGMKNENKDLHAKIQAVENVLNTQVKKVQLMSAQEEGLTSQNLVLESNGRMLQQKLQQAQSEIADFSPQRYNEYADMITEKRKELSLLNQKIQQAKRKVNLLQEELTRYTRQVTELTNQSNQLQYTYDQLKSGNRISDATTTNKMSFLQQSKSRMNQQLTNTSIQIQEADLAEFGGRFKDKLQLLLKKFSEISELDIQRLINNTQDLIEDRQIKLLELMDQFEKEKSELNALKLEKLAEYGEGSPTLVKKATFQKYVSQRDKLKQELKQLQEQEQGYIVSVSLIEQTRNKLKQIKAKYQEMSFRIQQHRSSSEGYERVLAQNSQKLMKLISTFESLQARYKRAI